MTTTSTGRKKLKMTLESRRHSQKRNEKKRWTRKRRRKLKRGSSRKLRRPNNRNRARKMTMTTPTIAKKTPTTRTTK